MTCWSNQYMPRDRNLPGLLPTAGEAFAKIAKTIFPFHTAKQMARAWDWKPETADSVTKGHLSIQSLTKAVQTQQHKSQDAWLLWKALGAQIIGEELEEYEARAVQAMLRGAERAAENVRSIHAQRRRLEESSPFAGLGLRVVPEQGRRDGSEPRRTTDGVGG